jgi:hypothetical protein
MPCLKCAFFPNYHSFDPLVKGDKRFFYTDPSKSIDNNEDGTKLANFKIHFEEASKKGPWTWVIDCGNMTIKDYTDFSFILSLINILENDSNIQEVCILRPTAWINKTIDFFKTVSSATALNKLRHIDKI